jgi:hypothetical protein
MQFSPMSCHFIPFSPNILNTLFSDTLSLCSSLDVRDQISHSYRTIGKIIVLYFLIFSTMSNRIRDVCFSCHSSGFPQSLKRRSRGLVQNSAEWEGSFRDVSFVSFLELKELTRAKIREIESSLCVV